MAAELPRKGKKRTRTFTAQELEPINGYTVMPKKFQDQPSVDYDRFDHYKLKLPANWLLTGMTGAGKTNILWNIIRNFNCFQRYFLYARDLEEPFYRWLQDVWEKIAKKLKHPVATIGSDLKNVVPIDQMDKTWSNLVIFDDMIAEKKRDLEICREYFIRGRKQFCTSVFISQNYFSTEKAIRTNTQYFVFMKVEMKRDLRMILGEFSLGVTVDQLFILYKYATQDGMPNFLLVDILSTDDNLRFRRNFMPMDWRSVLGMPASTPALPKAEYIGPAEYQHPKSKRQKTSASPHLINQSNPAPQP